MQCVALHCGAVQCTLKQLLLADRAQILSRPETACSHFHILGRLAWWSPIRPVSACSPANLQVFLSSTPSCTAYKVSNTCLVGLSASQTSARPHSICHVAGCSAGRHLPVGCAGCHGEEGALALQQQARAAAAAGPLQGGSLSPSAAACVLAALLAMIGHAYLYSICCRCFIKVCNFTRPLSTAGGRMYYCSAVELAVFDKRQDLFLLHAQMDLTPGATHLANCLCASGG